MEFERMAKCPYQKGKNTILCEAMELMVPSIEEEKQYCEGDFRNCPYYQRAWLLDMKKETNSV